jgi:3-isopropylmalate dehydratase large subunit
VPPMHPIHKILAAAAGRNHVAPGEIVTVPADLCVINDIYAIVIDTFDEMEGKAVRHPERVAIFMDHNAPSATVKGADNQQRFRQFAGRYGIDGVFEVNEGICHAVLPERGMIKPGMIVLITDSHATTHGALGAFSVGVGASDMAAALITGEVWLRVPTVVRVALSGSLAPGVQAKDVMLFLLGRMGANHATYKVLEYAGPTIAAMSPTQRMVLTNMAVEMGAKTAYVHPDQGTAHSPDLVYERSDSFEVGGLVPQVALPGRVDRVCAVADAPRAHVHQVFVGSCTGGSLEDIATVAKVLEGRRIAAGTRMVVTMASKDIVRASIAEGYYQTLLDAGASITAPGCGACSGLHGGLLAAGETCLSTANRNFTGRMGSSKAEIMLVSPATAAASALTGRLSDPREHFQEEPAC